MTVKYSNRTGLMVVATKGEDVYEQMKSRDRYIDSMINGEVSIIVTDPNDINAKNNRVCLIGNDGSGVFAGKVGHIAIYHDTENGNSTAGWETYAPYENMRISVSSYTGKGPFIGNNAESILEWKFCNTEWRPQFSDTVVFQSFEADPTLVTGFGIFIVNHINTTFEFVGNENRFAFQDLYTNQWRFVDPYVGQKALKILHYTDPVTGNVTTNYTQYQLIKMGTSWQWRDVKIKNVINVDYTNTSNDMLIPYFSDKGSVFAIDCTQDTDLYLTGVLLTNTYNVSTIEINLMINPNENKLTFKDDIMWEDGVEPDLTKNSTNFISLTGVSSTVLNAPVKWYGKLKSKGHMNKSFSFSDIDVDKGIVNSFRKYPNDTPDYYDYGFDVIPAERSSERTIVFLDFNGSRNNPLSKAMYSTDLKYWSESAAFTNVDHDFNNVDFESCFREYGGVLGTDAGIIVLPNEGGGDSFAAYSYDDGDTFTTKIVQQTQRSQDSGYDLTGAIAFFPSDSYDGGVLVKDRDPSNDYNNDRYYRFFSPDIGDGDVENPSNAIEVPKTSGLLCRMVSIYITSTSNRYVYWLYDAGLGTYPIFYEMRLIKFDKINNVFVDLRLPSYYFNKNKQFNADNYNNNTSCNWDHIYAINDSTLILSSGWQYRSQGDIYSINSCLWVSYNGGFDWVEINVSNTDIPIFEEKRFFYDKFRNVTYMGVFHYDDVISVYKMSTSLQFEKLTLPLLLPGETYRYSIKVTKEGLLMVTNAGRIVVVSDFTDPMWPYVSSVFGFQNSLLGDRGLYQNTSNDTFLSLTGSNVSFDSINIPFGVYSLKFDGTYGIADINDLIPSGIYTIEVQVRFEDFPSTLPTQAGELKKYAILSQNYLGGANDKSNHQVIYFDQNGKIGLYRGSQFGNTTWQIDELSSQNFVPNTWYYVKLICDGTNIKLYVDNVLQIDFVLDLESLPIGDKGWHNTGGGPKLGTCHAGPSSPYNFSFKGNFINLRTTAGIRNEPIPIAIFPTN